MQQKNSFRHESLQDRETIEKLLKSITRGLGKGEMSFSDDEGEIALHPDGLLNLKVTASKEEGRERFTLRVTWQVEEKQTKGKRLLRVK
jgi:amphi-Trp domain-containing protein